MSEVRQRPAVLRPSGCTASVRSLRARPVGSGCRRRTGSLCDPVPRNARRWARSVGRDQVLTAAMGASAVVGTVDPDRRGSNAAPAQSGVDRAAISSPPPRYLAAVLINGSGHGRHDPVSPPVLADRVLSAGGAVVARARLVADRAAVLEAR